MDPEENDMKVWIAIYVLGTAPYQAQEYVLASTRTEARNKADLIREGLVSLMKVHGVEIQGTNSEEYVYRPKYPPGNWCNYHISDRCPCAYNF